MPHIDPALLPAVFGLLGVIVGGAITAGVDYFLDERRAFREETKERRKRLIDLKRAARLIDQDFSWALAALNLAIMMKHWVAPQLEPIRLESWREHRSVLAAETTWAAWTALINAVQAMESYRDESTDAIGRNEWTIDADGLRSRESDREAIAKGREALKPFLDLAIE
jgi:hypothetical protein